MLAVQDLSTVLCLLNKDGQWRIFYCSTANDHWAKLEARRRNMTLLAFPAFDPIKTQLREGAAHWSSSENVQVTRCAFTQITSFLLKKQNKAEASSSKQVFLCRLWAALLPPEVGWLTSSCDWVYFPPMWPRDATISSIQARKTTFGELDKQVGYLNCSMLLWGAPSILTLKLLMWRCR